ncbi:MAG: YtxH domain-containing protein [Anaerolineales bacterium]|nr:YtxH domain-containing protein [Anaerolineales bacterium]
MKRTGDTNNNKRNVATVVTGILVGGVVGATVGLLMAPTSGQETRRRITGDVKGIRAKAKNAKGNVESRARELAKAVREDAGEGKKTVARRRKAASTRSR